MVVVVCTENKSHFEFMEKTKLVCGVGINDVEEVYENGRPCRFYLTWHNMLQRCYDEKMKEKKKLRTYTDCTVCEEWKTLSKFKKWFDKHYIEGYDLDKDLLVKGNKEYSPRYCVFLPRELNKTLERFKQAKGGLPRGVRYTWKKDKYVARLSIYSQDIVIGTFDNLEDARKAYCIAREARIKIMALKYKGKIEKRAFDALMRYIEE